MPNTNPSLDEVVSRRARSPVRLPMRRDPFEDLKTAIEGANDAGPNGVLSDADEVRRRQLAKAQSLLGKGNAFAVNPNMSQTGLGARETAMLDTEDQGVLRDATGRLGPGNPMYAEFGGQKFVGFGKPRLARTESFDILKWNAAKKAREEAMAAQREQADRAERMRREELNAPIEQERVRAELRRKDMEFERGLTKEDRDYERQIRERELKRDEDRYTRERAVEDTPEQARARREYESYGQSLEKRAALGDPRAQAALQKLYSRMGTDADAAGALATSDPAAMDEATDAFIGSSRFNRARDTLLRAVRSKAGLFSSARTGDIERALAPLLERIRNDAKRAGADPDAAADEVLNALEDEFGGNFTGLFGGGYPVQGAISRARGQE